MLYKNIYKNFITLPLYKQHAVTIPFITMLLVAGYIGTPVLDMFIVMLAYSVVTVYVIPGLLRRSADANENLRWAVGTIAASITIAVVLFLNPVILFAMVPILVMFPERISMIAPSSNNFMRGISIEYQMLAGRMNMNTSIRELERAGR